MRPGSALPVELRTVFKGCALLADADDKTSKPPPLMDLVRRERGSPAAIHRAFCGGSRAELMRASFMHGHSRSVGVSQSRVRESLALLRR